MDKLAKQQACQLFIEQEIEKGLAAGMSTYSIGKNIAQWIQKLFEVKINPDTIRVRADRLCTNVHTDSTQENQSKIEENQEIKFEHGGIREGAGRPPKFSVKIGNGDYYQSSASPEWETPQWLFDILNKEFHFTLDVCATTENAKCKEFFSKEENGLTKDWKGICWMNPPYGREISEWMRKARIESENGILVVCLVPARTDTIWWWDNCIYGEIRFLKGRLEFGKIGMSAPFPSAVVILKKDIKARVIWWNLEQLRDAKGQKII